METIKTIQMILLTMVGSLVFSCQQIPEDENSPSGGSGTFGITGWGGTTEMEFGYGANGGLGLTGIPSIGTIWNGMIVADVSNDMETSLLLMTLDEWEGTISMLDDILSDCNVNGISGWRLPSHDEASLLRARFSGSARTDLNERIAEYDEDLLGLDGEERYLCVKGDMFYSFKFVEGASITKAGEKRSYYIRLVKTYRMDF